MADLSVQMAEAGCNYIAVLGVDFMSENVRAILTQAGYEHVKVNNTTQNVHSAILDLCINVRSISE